VTTTRWLLDKSAFTRLPESPDAQLWVDRIRRGLVLITTPTLLEIGYSARSGEDWRNNVEQPPLALMPVATFTPAVETRAVEIQGVLARRGHHRAPSVADLLVAAVAELEQLTILHVDKDFELIAEVTGQDLERLRVA
jgi:predicted nucleic acid-binding protein